MINTVLNASRMLLTVLIPLITFPYTSRIFLTEGSGRLNFSSSIVQLFVLLASLGIYSYGVREGTKVRNDRNAFSVFAQELFFINILSTLLTYICFFCCVFLLPSFKNYRLLLLINGVTIGFTALGLDWVYGVYEDYIYITVRQIIVQVFTIIAMFLFVHDISDIYLWAFLLVLSNSGANVFNIVHARKYVDFHYKRNNHYKIRPHIRPIIILFMTQLATKVYLNIDTILLGIQSTDHHVGLYSAAVKLNTILITFFTAMMPVFVPKIVEAISNDRKQDYIVLIKKIHTLIVSLTLPAVIGIEIFGKEIITLLAGEAFIDATITIRILAPIVLITSLANVFYYNILVPNGKEKAVLYCTIVGAICNLIISVILIPFFQENGAAMGSLISEILALLMAIQASIKIDKSLVESKVNIRNYSFGCAGIILWCMIVKILFTDKLFVLLVGIIGSVCIYGIVLLVFKDMVAVEMINVVKKKLKR